MSENNLEKGKIRKVLEIWFGPQTERMGKSHGHKVIDDSSQSLG